ncbi:MAG: hypothetical protein HY814_14335 [Candidatus Riflebacteria bacterium]|nr:hypothetical protein [Candidatus Riflebacteria bacterium]
MGILFLGVAPLVACDPDHAWSQTANSSAPMMLPRAVEAMVDVLVRRTEPPPTAKDRVALLSVADDSPAESRIAEAPNRFAALFEQALRRQTGTTVLTQSAIVEELHQSGLGAEALYSPAFFAKLVARKGATLMLKVRLAAYAREIRSLTDLNPANRGLEATQVVQRLRVRLSLQDPDGRYRFIDEVEGTAFESYIFAMRGGQPVSAAEAFIERPGRRPLDWTALKDHQHFKF